VAEGEAIVDLETALGYRFERKALLDQALTHASAASAGGTASLERLEFLGDRVLGLAIASDLMRRFPDEDEGALARRLASLASGETLAGVARELGLAHFLRADSGVSEGGVPSSVLEDVCEAVIGAIYLDGGLAPAAALIERLWAPLMTDRPPNDAKTELQEWVQARRMALPVYRTVAAEGPPHAPVFTVEAAIEGLGPTRAEAGSKRAAERAAAEELLARAKAGNG
jgi:ribonuclease-3